MGRRNEKRIVLASTSPRRREILESAGIEFIVIPSRYRENIKIVEDPVEVVRILAREKADEVANRTRNAIVIAADTIVYCDGQKFGKPSTPEKAREILEALSGRQHSVFTGYAFVETPSERRFRRAVETRVWFRQLSKEDIANYVETGEPLHKAGAYAIDGGAADFVDPSHGPYSRNVDFPIEHIIKDLKAFYPLLKVRETAA